MRVYFFMRTPTTRARSKALKILPIIGGFLLFTALAGFNNNLAIALAVAVIGFAALSMLLALTRKH
jgi:hypothetical protein